MLTFGDVADDKIGSIPPHASMMLSTICDIRCSELCTKIRLSFELTMSDSGLEILENKAC